MIHIAVKRTWLALALCFLASLAQAQDVVVRHVLPEEVVQSSIQVLRPSTNTSVVRWVYTEAGATNMLAFFVAHEGQQASTVIGTYESPAYEINFKKIMTEPGSYEQWKQDWLKRRTDKLIVRDEEDLKKILDGLKAK